MSIQFTGGTIGSRKVKLSSTGVTDIVASGTNRQTVDSINVAEINGSTPTITLEIYDNTTSYFICKGLMLSANQVKVFNQGWLLEPGEKIRATASAANQLDVIATVVEQNPGASV